MKDKFASYHPIVNFIYFAVILLMPMLYLHPIIIAIALCSGTAYTICQQGLKSFLQRLPLIAVVFLLSALINPLFNHRGATKLFYFSNGSVVTLESVLYGLLSGIMLTSVILWFGCFYEVMTSDKIMQLFGKRMPSLSLLFTITLRFVPRFMEQIRRVSEAQKGAGFGISAESPPRQARRKVAARIRHGLKILSITITWAFEHSIETSDSMKSRGYGLVSRNTYARARFDTRDGGLMGLIGLLSTILFAVALTGGFAVRYYPQIEIKEAGVMTTLAYASYGILAFLPVILQGMEEITWKYFRSKI